MIATLLLLSLAAGGPRCPPPGGDTAVLSPAALAARRAALEAERGGALPACLPALDLALGELLTRQGEAGAALAPLTRAIAGSIELRPRAFAALGRAQALAGQPFEALRSLGLVRRLAAADPFSLERSRELTYLLARLHLRRGGSIHGLYHFDTGYHRVLKGELKSAHALAAAEAAIAVLGKDGALSLLEPPLALPDLGAERPRAIAAATPDLVALLGEHGALARSDGLRATLVLPEARGGLAATSFALTPDGEIYVLGGGALQRFDAAGNHLRAIPIPHGVIAVAADARARIHLLRGDRGGLLTIDREGGAVGEVAASGDGYQWSSAHALAADVLGGTYVLSRSASAIFIFDPAGEFAGRVDPPNDDPGLLRSARSIAVDGRGDLYVLTRDGDAVERYR